MLYPGLVIVKAILEEIIVFWQVWKLSCHIFALSMFLLQDDTALAKAFGLLHQLLRVETYAFLYPYLLDNHLLSLIHVVSYPSRYWWPD